MGIREDVAPPDDAQYCEFCGDEIEDVPFMGPNGETFCTEACLNDFEEEQIAEEG